MRWKEVYLDLALDLALLVFGQHGALSVEAFLDDGLLIVCQLALVELLEEIVGLTTVDRLGLLKEAQELASLLDGILIGIRLNSGRNIIKKR